MIIDDISSTAPADDGARCLDQFRFDLYGCLTGRGDELFELTDAILCSPVPVTDLARL